MGPASRQRLASLSEEDPRAARPPATRSNGRIRTERTIRIDADPTD